MRTFTALLAVAITVIAIPRLHAQSAPPPRITVVMPPGAKAGDTVELTVTGQDLDDVEGLYFSFPAPRSKCSPPRKRRSIPRPRSRAASRRRRPPTRSSRSPSPRNAPLGTHDVRVVTKGGVSNPRAFVVGDSSEVLEKEPNDDVPQAQKIDLNTTVSGVISHADRRRLLRLHRQEGPARRRRAA